MVLLIALGLFATPALVRAGLRTKDREQVAIGSLLFLIVLLGVTMLALSLRLIA
jgi:hypothetical protein